VNDYLYEIFDEVFQPLIQLNVFHQIKGGAKEGAHLCQHPLVDDIHITGSDKTHDMIVWGGTTEKEKSGSPKLQKEITSELGCVTPWIIVGADDWSDSDLDYHASCICGAVFQNVSFNCNAAKLLVTRKGWKLREKFLKKIRDFLRKLPARYAYYPGAKDRYDGFMKEYPQAEVLGSKASNGYIPWTMIEGIPTNNGEKEYALCTEPFCPIISECTLDVDEKSFLPEAVKFCNRHSSFLN